MSKVINQKTVEALKGVIESDEGTLVTALMKGGLDREAALKYVAEAKLWKNLAYAELREEFRDLDSEDPDTPYYILKSSARRFLRARG